VGDLPVVADEVEALSKPVAAEAFGFGVAVEVGGHIVHPAGGLLPQRYEGPTKALPAPGGVHIKAAVEGNALNVWITMGEHGGDARVVAEPPQAGRAGDTSLGVAEHEEDAAARSGIMAPVAFTQTVKVGVPCRRIVVAVGVLDGSQAETATSLGKRAVVGRQLGDRETGRDVGSNMRLSSDRKRRRGGISPSGY
jgi:hypothetical protein